MNNKAKYNEIISAPIEYEIHSVNKKVNTTLSLFILIIICITFSIFSYINGLFGGDKILSVIALNIVIVSAVMLPVIMLNNASGMKLIFTANGIALFPNTFILGIPLYTFVAEKWDNILFYKIVKMPKLMKMGTDNKRQSYLYIRTDGVIPRCVNNYGMSVFAVTGHHLSEYDITVVNIILSNHSIELRIDE